MSVTRSYIRYSLFCSEGKYSIMISRYSCDVIHVDTLTWCFFPPWGWLDRSIIVHFFSFHVCNLWFVCKQCSSQVFEASRCSSASTSITVHFDWAFHGSIATIAWLPASRWCFRTVCIFKGSNLISAVNERRDVHWSWTFIFSKPVRCSITLQGGNLLLLIWPPVRVLSGGMMEKSKYILCFYCTYNIICYPNED